MTQSATQEADGAEMTLWEHLAELRRRLFYMLLAFVAGGIATWIYREQFLAIITKPFVAAWQTAQPGSLPELISLTPAGLFLAYVRLAALGGLILAVPFILYQLWAFVAPGLYSREKRFAIPFVLSSCGLFAGGGWFGWRFAFPVAFAWLLGFGSQIGLLSVKQTITLDDYLTFIFQMLLAFGLTGELPVLVFFLAFSGLVDHKQLIRFFRYFIIIAFVIAAVVTPPDPVSQLMLAVPLCLLYAVSILVAYVFHRKRASAAEKAESAP